MMFKYTHVAMDQVPSSIGFKFLFLSSDREESEKAFRNNDGGYRFLAATI
jgi:hypothetical protein